MLKNRHYTETEQFQAMINKVKNGELAYWCETEEDVHTYFNELRLMIESVRKNGYQEEGRRGAAMSHKGFYPDEILVSESGGKYYLERGGTHRLTLCKLLNIESIKVCIIRSDNLRSIV